MMRALLPVLAVVLGVFVGVAGAQEAVGALGVQFVEAPQAYLGQVEAWYGGLSDAQKTQVGQTAGIALIAVVGVVLMLVATRRVVFYYDRSDALWSMSIYLLPLLGGVLSAMLTPENATAEEQVLPGYLFVASLLGSGFAAAVSVYKSIRYNGVFVGLIVGAFKIVMGLLMLLTVWGIFSSATDRNRSYGDRVVAVAILGLVFGLLWKLLVNGIQVEQRRELRAAAAA